MQALRLCLKRLELWKRAARVAMWRRHRGIEVRSSGDAMQELRLCLKRPGALEACCACSDVEEALRFGALEMRCSRVDVEMFASRDLELWRHAAGVASLSQERH